MGLVSKRSCILLYKFVFLLCFTCNLVPDQLAGLNLSNATKQTFKFFLGHVLRQVVDDQVGFAVVRGAICTNDWAVGQTGSAWTVGHLGFHGADYLLGKRAELFYN